MLRFTNEEIFDLVKIKKIVKTKDVICSCGGDRVCKLYSDIDTKSMTAYNNKKQEKEKINEYTELEIDYCKDCGRVDYITAEQGLTNSYRMYLREDNPYYCECGLDKIDDGEGYVVILQVDNGNMIVKNKHCNNKMVIGTEQIFNRDSRMLIGWLNEVAEVEVNPKEKEFYEEQQRVIANLLGFAVENNARVYMPDEQGEIKQLTEEELQQKQDTTRPYVTTGELIENIDEIEKVWTVFKAIYTKKVNKNNGMINFEMINEAIKEAKRIAKTSVKADYVVEGFFDKFAGLLNMTRNSEKTFLELDKTIREYKEIHNN